MCEAFTFTPVEGYSSDSPKLFKNNFMHDTFCSELLEDDVNGRS
jgi:hypothetical protein